MKETDTMNVIERIRDKDSKAAHAFVMEAAESSKTSGTYLPMMEEIASLLSDDSSYVRTRAFILCLAQANRAGEERFFRVLPGMLSLLHDEKPTVVRQCLAELTKTVGDVPFLKDPLRRELGRMDLSVYKDSMAPLIEKDREALLREIGKEKEKR